MHDHPIRTSYTARTKAHHSWLRGVHRFLDRDNCDRRVIWVLAYVTLVVPMFIAGILQTLNKFGQYLGLHGQTVLGLTRTVVDRHSRSHKCQIP
jgi:hypothetical protein